MGIYRSQVSRGERRKRFYEFVEQHNLKHEPREWLGKEAVFRYKLAESYVKWIVYEPEEIDENVIEKELLNSEIAVNESLVGINGFVYNLNDSDLTDEERLIFVFVYGRVCSLGCYEGKETFATEEMKDIADRILACDPIARVKTGVLWFSRSELPEDVRSLEDGTLYKLFGGVWGWNKLYFFQPASDLTKWLVVGFLREFKFMKKHRMPTKISSRRRLPKPARNRILDSDVDHGLPIAKLLISELSLKLDADCLSFLSVWANQVLRTVCEKLGILARNTGSWISLREQDVLSCIRLLSMPPSLESQCLEEMSKPLQEPTFDLGVIHLFFSLQAPSVSVKTTALCNVDLLLQFKLLRLVEHCLKSFKDEKVTVSKLVSCSMELFPNMDLREVTKTLSSMGFTALQREKYRLLLDPINAKMFDEDWSLRCKFGANEKVDDAGLLLDYFTHGLKFDVEAMKKYKILLSENAEKVQFHKCEDLNEFAEVFSDNSEHVLSEMGKCRCCWRICSQRSFA